MFQNVKQRRTKRNIGTNLLDSSINGAGVDKYGDPIERSQVFWKNEMNVAEIRKLQS